MTAEQTIAIIETTAKAVKPADTNYGWLLLLAMIPIVPILIKIYLDNKKNKR